MKRILFAVAILVMATVATAENYAHSVAFKDWPGFSSWGNSYSLHNYTFDNVVDVTLSSAAKATVTITDIPVSSKSGTVTVKHTDSNTEIVAVRLKCRKWSSNAQTITLNVSTDGETFSTLNPSVTSSNFDIESSSLGEGVKAVRFTFNNNKQVGIELLEITFAGETGTTPPVTVAVPTFSVAEGGFSAPFDLELSAAEGTSIYYTLDGTTEPTTSSSLYTAPIHIEQTTTVKAIASDGTDVSAVASATYTLTDYDYTFALIPTDFDQWGNSYTSHTSDFEDYDTKISSDKIANPDSYSYPAIKGGYLIVSSISGKTIKAIRLICNQWGTYTQTIKLEVSSDSNNYTGTTPTTTSNNFDIENQSLPEGTTHVKFTFSNTSRQILLRTLYISFNNNEEEATVDSIAITGNSNDLYTCDDFSHEGITVTAYYDNETSENVTNKATYSGYDPNNLGEQTITVEYGGQTATYSVTVKSLANDASTAYTIQEAKGHIDNRSESIRTSTTVYVKGYVSSVESLNSDGSLNYYIASEQNSREQEFELYKGKSFNGDAFTDDTKPAVGDFVIVSGHLTKYTRNNNDATYELNSGNILVTRTSTPTFTIANVDIAKGETVEVSITTNNTDDYTITYTSSDDEVATVDEDGIIYALALGTATITAEMAATDNFFAASTTFTVNVIQDLQSITLNTDNAKTIYALGETFTPAGIVVTAHYLSAGDLDIEESDFDGFVTFTGYNTNTLGEQTVTVTYNDGDNEPVSAEYTITVKEASDILMSIDIVGSLVNTEYFIGDTISLEGLTVIAYYGEEFDEVDVTDQVTWEMTFNTPLTAEDTVGIIIAHFEEKEAELDNVIITVKDNLSGITLNTDDVKTEYTIGETFSASGLVVTAHYLSNDMEIEDSDFEGFVTFTGYNMLSPGTQTVTVTFNDGDFDPVSAEYQITVIDPTVYNRTVYQLITSMDDLTDGVYVFATEHDGQGKLFTLDNSYVTSTPIDIDIIDGEIIAWDANIEEHEVTITAVAGGYTVEYKDKYIGDDPNNKKHFMGVETPIVWTITMLANGELDLENKDNGNSYKLYYHYDKNNTYIRWYSPKNAKDYINLKLFKKEGSSAQRVTIGTEGISSFCSHYALDFTDVEGVTAYKATLLNTESIHLEPIEGTVAAGTGIMLMGTEGEEVNIPIVDDGDSYEDNLLRPAFLGELIPCTDTEYDRYVFGTVEGVKAFYRLMFQGIESTGNFAYLEISTAVNASSVIKIGDEEVPQPTDDPTLDQDDENAQTYNLLGIPVPRDFKGIVIRNGKKYFNK